MRLNSSPVTTLSYTADEASQTSSVYGISVVYDAGESQQADVSVGNTDGVSSPLLQPLSVSVNGHCLTVNASPADMFDAVGMRVAHLNNGGGTSVYLPSGIYTVRMNGSSIKVAIK